MKQDDKQRPAIRPDLPHDKPIDPINAAESITEKSSILSDILGSYTGMTADGDRPEQDPDDL